MRADAKARAKPRLDFPILGSDRNGSALGLARKAARDAGVQELVRFQVASVDRLDAPRNPVTVVTNPPYGIRLEDGPELHQSWRQLGSFLHRCAKGTSAWVLSGNRETTRELGLRASKKLEVRNASIECRFLQYEIGDPVGAKSATVPDEGEPKTLSRPLEASEWVELNLAEIPEGAEVLDLACGSGRHTRLLLQEGFRVCAVDRDEEALETLRASLEQIPGATERCELVHCDLEGGSPWPFEGRKFGGVVVARYLWRPLFESILQSIDDGGTLIYETFTIGQERFGKPKNPDFLLRPNELLDVFAKELTVLAYEHGTFEEPKPQCLQRICARRPLATD